MPEWIYNIIFSQARGSDSRCAKRILVPGYQRQKKPKGRHKQRPKISLFYKFSKINLTSNLSRKSKMPQYQSLYPREYR